MSNTKIAKSENYPRIAIVTGATSGIGEATARRFISSGYAVVGNGRTAETAGAGAGTGCVPRVRIIPER